MADVSPYVAFVANAVFLLGFHAHADASEATAPETLLDRLSQGPDALNTLDKLLFGVLILLAFELLDFITSHSGSKFILSLSVRSVCLVSCTFSYANAFFILSLSGNTQNGLTPSKFPSVASISIALEPQIRSLLASARLRQHPLFTFTFVLPTLNLV